MTHVTNLFSTDGEIKFRMCSEGCPAGALGDYVVVKNITAIPFYIIHFLGLKITPLKFDSD